MRLEAVFVLAVYETYIGGLLQPDSGTRLYIHLDRARITTLPKHYPR